MFSSKKIFFSSQNDNYPIINGENPYNLPTNEFYTLDSCVDLKVSQGNEVSFQSNPSGNNSIVGIPSQEKAIILDGSSIVLDAPLKNSDGSTTNFGKEVSIFGELAIVSAPDYKHKAISPCPNCQGWPMFDYYGYVSAYVKGPLDKWLQVGTFCSNDLQVAKPSFDFNTPKINFGKKIFVYNDGFRIFYKKDTTGHSGLFGIDCSIEYQDFLPCRINQQSSVGIPDNTQTIIKGLNMSISTYVYADPNFSNSDSFVGEVAIAGNSVYGTSYSKLGYSIGICNYSDISNSGFVFCGAPGIHPVLPFKGKVYIYDQSAELQHVIEGINNNDGFGKAVCAIRNVNDIYSITASNSYMRCDKVGLDSIEIGSGYSILNLRQGVEILQMQGNRNRDFAAILSVDGKIYCAVYDMNNLFLSS